MKLFTLLLGFAMIIGGCSAGKIQPNPNSNSNPIKGNSIIDWVDFVKLNDQTYTGMYELVLSDPSDVTDEVVGEVKFKVGDVVTNPDYKTQPGDAAFLEIGTKLYQVKGFAKEELIAAKDEASIGGYRLYAGEDHARSLGLRYKDIPKDQVASVALYRFDETAPFNTLKDRDKERFIELLDHGTDKPGYSPENKDGDPDYYQMVFFMENGQLGYAYSLADDGVHVFFHPWDTRLVKDEIRNWLKP